MTRTFLAIELNAEARSHLQRQIERLALALPQVQWVNPASLHLTLAFLGELTDQQLAEATTAAQETARTSQPFTLRIAALGTFGPPTNPRVVWAGVTGDLQRLLDFQSRLAAALTARGFPPEERIYSPHLTLARIKDPLSAHDLATLQRLIPLPTSTSRQSQRHPPAVHQDSPSIPVDALSVMKSELLRDGAHYTCLLICRFGTLL